MSIVDEALGRSRSLVDEAFDEDEAEARLTPEQKALKQGAEQLALLNKLRQHGMTPDTFVDPRTQNASDLPGGGLELASGDLAASRKDGIPDKLTPVGTGLDLAAGVGEATLSTVTGIPAYFGSGLQFLASILTPGVSAEEATKQMLEFQKNNTYQPTTKAGKQAAESAGTLMALPFEGWKLIGQGAGDYVFDKTGSPEAAATVATVLEGLPFVAPGIYKGVTKTISTLQNSSWYREMTVKERGLMALSLTDMLNKGMSEGEVLRRWNNPQWREEALQRRVQGETAAEQPAGEAPAPATEKPVAAAPARAAAEREALPPGQGFEIVGDRPRGMDLVPSKTIRLGNEPAPKSIVEEALGRPETPYENIINHEAEVNSLDPALVKAIVKQESNFNPKATSKKGAKGLMQLMPATAKELGVKDATDPDENIAAGTKYFKQLLDKYDGDEKKALAAYNWGPARVDKYGIDKLPRATKEYLAAVEKARVGYAGEKPAATMTREEPSKQVEEQPKETAPVEPTPKEEALTTPEKIEPEPEEPPTEPTMPETFREYVESQGKAWPVRVSDPDYPRLKGEWDAIEKGVIKPKEEPHPESLIINPIDVNAPQEEKVKQLVKLSEENEPLIQGLTKKIDDALGTESKYSFKEPKNILSKANRPEIKAEKPWHDVEHIRDSLRFKTKLNSFDDIPAIASMIQDEGAEIVKADFKKMFQPKEWGWRFIGFDLRMPNGQLVEFYSPFKELDSKGVKDVNHLLFEKWRNKTEQEKIASWPDYQHDVKESKDRYDRAFSQALRRLGLDENSARASFNKAVERVESSMREKLSLRSSAEGTPTPQTPSRDLIKEASGSAAQMRPSSASDANSISKQPPVGTDNIAPEPPKVKETQAARRTREQIKDIKDVPINPKVEPLVTELNNRDIPTNLSGDLYGSGVVYVDLPGGTYVKGELAEGTDEYEKLLKNADLPEGWEIIPADVTGSTAFIEEKPEAAYPGPRSTRTRIIRKGDAVSPEEAKKVADSVEAALNEKASAPAPAPTGTKVTKLQGVYKAAGKLDEYANSLEAEKAFKKDLKQFAKVLKETLGYGPEMVKKGKKEIDNSVHTNIPPAGGEGSILLWKPGSEYGVYVQVHVERDGKGGLKVRQGYMPGGDMLWRATTKAKKYNGLINQWAPHDISAEDLAERIQNEVDFHEAVNSQKIIQEAKDAGHTDTEIAQAFTEGERAGEIEGNDQSPQEAREAAQEIAAELGINPKPDKRTGTEVRAARKAMQEIEEKLEETPGSYELFANRAKQEAILSKYGKGSLDKAISDLKHARFLFEDEEAEDNSAIKDAEETIHTIANKQLDLLFDEGMPIIKAEKGEKDATERIRPPRNDRRGLKKPGPEDLPRVEEVGEPTVVPEGKRIPADGKLRGSKRGGPDDGTAIEGNRSSKDRTGHPRSEAKGVGGSRGNAPRIQRQQRGRDHVIEPGDLAREGSWKNTAITNLDIIELVKRLDAEKRQATPEEQKLLARYTGWGASEIANKLFPGFSQTGEVHPSWGDQAWQPLAERLVNLLTPEEISAAARSTQYAHYTSQEIINSIYRAVDRFGFPGGKILEPGMGVGSFMGLLPETMRGASVYTGIEFDPVTAKIAQYLYPNQNIINADYTKQKLPNDFFDLAIGNPPFSPTTILADPDYKKLRLPLHDYFFVKSLDKVRPGGLLVFITSRFTLDKVDDKVRGILAEKADLMGAIRLPQTAFLKNAGTEVVTDILFLRKKTPGEETFGQKWNDVREVETPDGKFRVNEYYHDHPDMVLGEHSGKGSMYGKNEYTVLPKEGNIEDQFAAAVERLPQNTYSMVKADPEQQAKAVIEHDFNPKIKKEGGLYVSDKGDVMVVENGRGVPVESIYKKITPKDKPWLKDYVALRDAVKQNQYEQLNDGDWETSLENLKKTYNAFVKKHGRLNEYTVSERKITDEDGNESVVEYRKYKNQRFLDADVESPLVDSLEKITSEGKIIEGPFLSGRTIKKPITPQVTSAPDALAVSLDTIGKLDLNHIANLLDNPKEEVAEQLGDLIYEEPGKDYVLADEYLSGDVVKKLEEAKTAAEVDPRFKRNVDALIKVLPAPLGPKEITVNPGGNWIPLEIYEDFVHEVLGLPDNVGVHYSHADNTWTIGAKAPSNRRSYRRSTPFRPQSQRGAASEWATPDRGTNELFESVLNNATIKITRSERVPGGGIKTYTDTAATAGAIEVAKKMKRRFQTWVWEDSNRASQLMDIWNTTKNNIAPRRFDGSHLTLPGVSLKIKLFDHVKRAVWRIIQTGNVYLGHAVGSGKTYEMIAGGMEMRRLGLIKKPIYVVPNHMLKQFANEFQELYPMANIMVADGVNFHTDRRRRFCAQATLNNPDAIVMTHSSFGLLKMKEENIKPVRDDLIYELRDNLSDLMEDRQSNRVRIKRIERQIEQAEQRFDSMIADGDKVVSFEDMGIDYAFVDEAHEFRKLDFTTNRQAKGIDSNGSRKAIDLYIKVKWLEKQNPGRSHTFASGTPITNTLGELYSLMRFFMEDQMAAEGISYFDSWANMFGNMASVPEMNAAGRYEIVERFSEFVNVPELMSRVRQFMDVITSSQLGGLVNRPTIKGGKPEIVITPPSDGLKAYQRGILQPRIVESRNWTPSKDEPGNPDPLINIITDGRLASIDLRYVDSKAKSDPKSKLNVFIDDIIKEYKATKNNAYPDPETGQTSPVKGGGQICFYNVGFGKMVTRRRGFDARAWTMKRFKDAGIPASQVAWIEDYDTAPKKEAMFKEMRNGTKRILIGSAKKMGTGLNVQRRLTTLQYLDPPWYPADVEQPDGRILRTGNLNKEVSLKRYATKGSYDATMWQMTARKAKFIEQAFTGDTTIRKLEDISETSQYEMAAALASGDERAIRLAGLKADINNLENLRTAHFDTQRHLKGQQSDLRHKIKYSQDRIKNLQEAEKKVPGFIHDIRGKIGASTFDKRSEFGEALIQDIVKRTEAVDDKEKGSWEQIATLNNFPLMLGLNQALTRNILRLKITPNVVYEIDHNITETGTEPKGLVTRIVNRLNGLGSEVSSQEGNLHDYQTELKKVEGRLGAPFEFAQELNDKIAETAQLEQELLEEGKETTSGPLSNERGSLGDISTSETLQAIIRLQDKIGEAMPHLINLGKQVYSEGNTRFKSWQATMKASLGNLWRKFKNAIKHVWDTVRKYARDEAGKIYWTRTKEKATSPKGKAAEQEIQKGEEAAKDLQEAYEAKKNMWFGNKDSRILRINVANRLLQRDLKDGLGRAKYDNYVKDVDRAIQIYIDTKRRPDDINKYWNRLTDEQRRIVTLSQNLPAAALKIAQRIENNYVQTGIEAMQEDVIKNVLDNYAGRTWDLGEGKKGTENLRKFATKTRHAKERKIATIIEGWANGYNLKIEGATNNLRTVKEELVKVIEDKKFLKAMRDITDVDGRPLLSTRQYEDYDQVEHPNFTVWEYATDVDLDETTVDEATGLRDGDFVRPADRKNLGKVVNIYPGEAVEVHFMNRKTGLEETVEFPMKNGKLVTPLNKVYPSGKNFFVTDDGTIMERRKLYAPKEVAKNLNNILGTSKLSNVPGMHTITKYNAIIKSWVLQSNLFHHLAFTRNYYLGTNDKAWGELSERQAYHEGMKAIEALHPDIMIGVRNGLTIGAKQDWEEEYLQEKTAIGNMLDKAGATKAIKNFMLDLRERQANFLFNEMGSGLKAKTFMIEYKRQLEKYPNEDPNVIAKRVAAMTNENYGGLHLGRMGRNPTVQHIFRLFALAPDWTESNIRLIVNTFKKGEGGPEARKMYQRMVMNWYMKGLAATALLNFVLAGGDYDEMMKNYKIAWEQGNLRWLNVDVTPLYRLFGGKTKNHKYFPLIGHMLDPIRLLATPVKFAQNKGSVAYRMFHEILTGTDWSNRHFTTMGDLLKTGKTVKWGPARPLSYDELPSFALSQIIGTEPVQLQNLIRWQMGEIEGFDAIMSSLGLGVTSTYIDKRTGEIAKPKKSDFPYGKIFKSKTSYKE